MSAAGEHQRARYSVFVRASPDLIDVGRYIDPVCVSSKLVAHSRIVPSVGVAAADVLSPAHARATAPPAKHILEAETSIVRRPPSASAARRVQTGSISLLLGILMPLVHIVVGLALAQFVFFCFAVGKARETTRLRRRQPPEMKSSSATSGVQMNTLEAARRARAVILLFGPILRLYLASALGVIYLVGRLIYFTSYVKDPKRRGAGYGLSALPVMVLLRRRDHRAIRAAVLTL